MGKGIFPYEYITDFNVLKETTLPPREAFDSELKDTKLSNHEYKRVQFVWEHYQMKSLKDLFIWYNNQDVSPFVDALVKQKEFYKEFGLDMLIDGVSLPSLAEKIMYRSALKRLKNIPKRIGSEFEFPKSRFIGCKEQDSKAKMEFGLTIKHLNELLIKLQYSCSHCRCVLNHENVSADRIDNSKGHIGGNIMISCVRCNTAGKNMNISSFRYQKT